MITLVIVDAQNDYLTGSVRVKGATEILAPIKEFVQQNKGKIDKIIFTVDWHPNNHCSFKTLGRHCVQFTPGACIEPKLLKFIQSLHIPYGVSTRGEMAEVDQPGAFEDIDFVQDELGSRYYFDSVVEADANTDFIICGINIKNTIENLLMENIEPKIFVKGSILNDSNLIKRLEAV